MAAGDDPREWSHVRVATKYPNITRRHFEARGVQAECVKLNGAMEIAPVLGLSSRIVDLVSTGGTLKANGLAEVEKIADISSRLIVTLLITTGVVGRSPATATFAMSWTICSGAHSPKIV